MIDTRFLDVDFTRDPRYVKGYDSFGNEGLFGDYEDIANLIPESEWKDRIAEIDAQDSGADSLVTRIYDQKQEGSCVANATCQAHEVMQALQFGKDRVTHLSAMSLYRRIGSGPQSGAMVSDGMDELASRGALPLDNPENRARFGDKVMPNTGWSNKFPADWELTAKNFRADEGNVIRSLAGMMTALLLRRPVVVGRQGHSIAYVRPMLKNGSYVAKFANSWSGGWGDAGFGYDTLSQMKMSSGWAWTPRSIVVPDHLA